MRRLAALAAALLVGGACLTVAPLTADAATAPMSSCTTSANVILAVNFSHWGGNIVRQCGTTPTTGYQLLNQGMFHTIGTQHDGPAFICRISSSPGSVGYPSPADESCGATPPASAYWSYWHAARGSNSWSYSNLGAMSFHPQPGSVDYWQFGGTNIAGTTGRPTVTPAQIRAGTPSARPASSSQAPKQTGSAGGSHHSTSSGGSTGGGKRHGSGAGAGAGGGTPRAGSTAAGSAKSSAAVEQRASSAAGSTSGSTQSSAASSSSSPTTAGSGGPTIVDARPASADTKRPSTGSLAPVLLGVTLAVLLAGGAGWTVWRRRRATAG